MATFEINPYHKCISQKKRQLFSTALPGKKNKPQKKGRKKSISIPCFLVIIMFSNFETKRAHLVKTNQSKC